MSTYHCPKCNRRLKESDVEGYSFTCHECDENYYKFEAIARKEPTINELLDRGVSLYSVAEVVQVTEPSDEYPYGREISLWKPPHPQDLHKPVESDWANREIASIWPIQDTRYPLLQIEVH